MAGQFLQRAIEVGAFADGPRDAWIPPLRERLSYTKGGGVDPHLSAFAEAACLATTDHGRPVTDAPPPDSAAAFELLAETLEAEADRLTFGVLPPEADALRRLAERDVWSVDELPPGIGEDVLRALDTDGFVEARACWMRTDQKFFGDPAPRVPAHGAWASPIGNRDVVGEWRIVLAKRARDELHRSFEVRVTERGRAHLWRLRSGAAPVTAAPAAVEPREPDAASWGERAAEARPPVDWKEVQGRLLVKRERGEPFTSLRKLGTELGCSDATIRKAINESDTLKGWRTRNTGPKAAPKATDLGAVVKDNRRQTTEPAPDDVLSDDDVDATMARLIDKAKPTERAKLNALDDAGRRALVATCHAQNLDDEPSPLEPNQPGEPSRKVKHHKRA